VGEVLVSSFAGWGKWKCTLIIAIVFVAVEVRRLSTVAGVVEEKGVVWACVADEPGHGAEDVGFCWNGHWVLLVVCEEDLEVLCSDYAKYAGIDPSYHVFPLIAKVIIEICGHILDIVDAAS
jgi:hypothetical protein